MHTVTYRSICRMAFLRFAELLGRDRACLENDDDLFTTGELERGSSSPPSGLKHLSQGGAPNHAAAQSMQPPPPVALPLGSAPIAQPSQDRLPHPMDPLPRLKSHACCSPPLWTPPAVPMQHPAAPRYPCTMPSSSIPMWAGPPGVKDMQEPPMPALQSHDNSQELDLNAAAKQALTGISAAAPHRPALLLAAALGRADVIHTLLAGTACSEPAQPFTDHR